MRILLPMQLKNIGIPILFFSLLFTIYAFYRGENADPFMFSMVSSAILIGSTYVSFLKDEKFHRNLLSMPIPTKEIIKTIYVSGLIAFLCLYIVSLLLSYYLTVNYGDSEYMEWTMTIFNTILVVLGVHIRYNLTTDMETNWGLEFLIFFGVFFLYGIPSMLFVIGLSEETLPLNFFIRSLIVFAISMFIYWRMYRKSVNTITAFYVEVEEKLKNGEHRSIHG
jgi:hypothetical protein